MKQIIYSVLILLGMSACSSSSSTVHVPSVNKLVKSVTIEERKIETAEAASVADKYNFDKGQVSSRIFKAYTANQLLTVEYQKIVSNAGKSIYFDGYRYIDETVSQTSRLSTLQIKGKAITETFYWTEGQEVRFNKMYSTYIKINGKTYLKSMIEKRSVDDTDVYEELYRIEFDYSNFLEGELKVEQKMLGETVGVDVYRIEFYDNVSMPDVFLMKNLFPLSCNKEFMMSGMMGTWDYYIVSANSELENGDYTMDYELGTNGLPKQMKLDKKDKEVSYRNETIFYSFIYQ